MGLIVLYSGCTDTHNFLSVFVIRSSRSHQLLVETLGGHVGKRMRDEVIDGSGEKL